MNKEAPKGWKTYKLKELYDIRRGGSPRPIEKFLTTDQDGINWIKIGDAKIGSKYIEETKEKITTEGAAKSRFVEEGDFILSNSMSFGRPYIMKTRGCIHYGWLVLKEKQDGLIYKDFMYYILSSENVYSQFKNAAAGGVVSNLNIQRVENVIVPIPPTLAEQQEIVQVLDTMSDIIRLREECISHAQDLIPALFQEMFGDINNNVTKSNIVRFRDCIELNPVKPNLKDNLNVTFLGMKDISENGQVDLSTIKMYEEVKKGFTNFENEDVLLAKITPCFENGKAAIVRNLINGYGFGSTEFYVLRPHQKLILPEYVYSIIKSHSFAEPGKYKMAGAAGQKRLPKEYVLNYKFPLPSIEMQERFAEKVREINSYIEEQQEELKNTKQMFQSLLHHAFTGELTRRAYGEN